MSVLLQAPFPSLQTTTVLPNPRFSDVTSRKLSVNKVFSMTGVRRTYTKKSGRRQFNLDFEISRMKALELRAFIQAYASSKIKLTTHADEVYVGWLMNNPFAIAGAALATSWPGSETCTVSLLFEGSPA